MLAGVGAVKGDMLSHSSPLLSRKTLLGVKASTENSGESPEVGV